MNAHRMSACSLSVVLAAVAGQAPCAAGVLVEKSLVESEGGAVNSLNAFGLTHTATGNSQLALSPTGALMVTNIGSSGLDGVSFPLGHGRGHSMIMSMGEMGLLAPGGEVAVYYPYSFGERCVYVRGDAGGGAVLGIDEQVHNPERSGRVSIEVTMLNGGVAFGAKEAYMMPMNEFILRNGVDVVTGDIGSDPLSGEGVSLRTEMTEWGYVHTMKLPVESVLQLLDENGVDSGVGGLADEVRIEVVGLPAGQLIGDVPGAPPEPVRVVARDLGQDLEIREHVLLASGVRSDNEIIKEGARGWTQVNGPIRARGGALFSGIDLAGIVTPFTDVTDPRWRNPNNPQAGIVVSNIGSSGLDGVEVDFAIRNICPDWAPYRCPDGSCAQSANLCRALPPAVQLLRLNDAADPMLGGIALPDDGDELSVEALTTDDAGVTTWTGGRVTLRNIPATGGFDYELVAQMAGTGATRLTVAVLDDGALQGVHTEFVNEANVMARLGNHPNVCQFIGLVPPEGDLVSVVPQTAGAYVFQLLGNADVEVGGAVYSGDALCVFVNDPPVAFPTRVSMRETSAGLAPHIVEMRSDEQPDDVVMVLGTRGQPEGGAVFLSQNDSLVVSNIGSSGLDGVSLDFEEATGFILPIEQGGEVSSQSFFDVNYYAYDTGCPTCPGVNQFGFVVRSVGPGRAVSSLDSSMESVGTMDAVAFDGDGNEVGRFTLEPGQSYSVVDPAGAGVVLGGVRSRVCGGRSDKCYGCDWVPSSGSGGVEVTGPDGVTHAGISLVEVIVAAGISSGHHGHVTVLKSQDPAGGGNGDMIFGPMSKKGYDQYMAKSDAGLRSGVITTGDGGSMYLINGIGEQEEGFGHDLGEENISVNPLADPVTHIPSSVSTSLASPPDNDVIVREIKKRIANPAGDLSVGGRATAGATGVELSVAVSEPDVPYRYHVEIEAFDVSGNLLASQTTPVFGGASPVLATSLSGPPDGWTWSDSDPARIRKRPDLLTLKWDVAVDIQLLNEPLPTTSVTNLVFGLVPEQPSGFDFDSWDAHEVLFKGPSSGEGFAAVDSSLVTFVPACPPDVNGDGVVDNGDIGTFIALFLAQDPSVDFTGDGVIDNGDIGAFIAAFLAGC